MPNEYRVPRFSWSELDVGFIYFEPCMYEYVNLRLPSSYLDPTGSIGMKSSMTPLHELFIILNLHGFSDHFEECFDCLPFNVLYGEARVQHWPRNIFESDRKIRRKFGRIKHVAQYVVSLQCSLWGPSSGSPPLFLLLLSSFSFNPLSFLLTPFCRFFLLL